MLYNKKTFIFFIVISFCISFKNKKTSSFSIPKGFPEFSIPEDNPITEDKIKLGKMLFFDKMLSRDSSISCASCHNPEYAFTDQLKKSIGIKGRVSSRNSPTLMNVAYNSSFLRDGVNPSLEAQVIVPIHEKNEFDFHILLAAERMKKIMNMFNFLKKRSEKNPIQK